MTRTCFFFWLLFLCISVSNSTPLYPYGFSYDINCGTSTNTTDSFNTTWISDRFFTGGSVALVSEPLRFQQPSEKTLRFFPASSYGKKNCYSFPSLPSGRYLLRTFTVYDNYDAKSRPPSFDVALSGTVLFSWRSPWPESVARDGAYSDLFAFVDNATSSTTAGADLCFYGYATDAPVVSSVELVQVDPASYDSSSTGENIVLVNYGRISCGPGVHWGAGFTNDTDRFGRSWQTDSAFRTKPGNSDDVRVVTTNSVSGADVEPNYFPMKLYQSAVTIDGELEYELGVDAKMDYMVWLHFAELDSSVKRAGERVFDVFINGNNVSRVDIYKEVGGFAAFTWHYTVKNLSESVLNIKLVAAVGAPIICGIENYALVANDPSTVPQQVTAMRALKGSLRVPDRMGWNGDPCAPTDWDAWEGVTCRMNNDKTALVISEIDLGRQGLKGYMSDQISLLSDLVSLNLSSNSLEGEIPSGLGQKSLIRLDLSNNQLTGSIPDSLASSSLQLVLLNDNLLEGRVPEQIYSVGVHGGAIDLSSNKGLCGVPSLPSCPMFWERGRLSSRGKIAIALSFLFVSCVVLLLVYICIRRKRNDYDFGLPHELMSLAAKRNKYQRQKSLMLLELESQHAKGLPSPFTPQ
ncbi:receptor-like protein 4 [Gastrolobium bilobum]|uniref:receptor-like protein 4 n=1 Tax=Gastrolobium bilobum TaxID=150636 RepID=UPI002AB31606|nr:receptor-like protein 4 [Gastrolobium bilobum]